MTNAFYDQAKPAPYRGTLRICPTCGAVVADDRRDRHQAWHDDLDLREEQPQIEVTEWDAEDETA